jgi:hypothetical protein
MGRVVTPKYRVEYRDNILALGRSIGDHAATIDGRSVRVYSQAWKGRATAERLEDWRKTMNQSFQAGGVNAHVSRAHGMVPHINYARIVEQRTGRVVAVATMPMFEAA